MLDILKSIVGAIVSFVVGRLTGRPAEDGLARVQAGIDAAKQVDNSREAVNADPNNLDAHR